MFGFLPRSDLEKILEVSFQHHEHNRKDWVSATQGLCEGAGSTRPGRWGSPWLFFSVKGFGKTFQSSEVAAEQAGSSAARWDEVLSFYSSYFPSASLLITASSFRWCGPKPRVCIDRDGRVLSVPGWKLGLLWDNQVFLGIRKMWNGGEMFGCRAGWEEGLRREEVLWLFLICSLTLKS